MGACSSSDPKYGVFSTFMSYKSWVIDVLHAPGTSKTETDFRTDIPHSFCFFFFFFSLAFFFIILVAVMYESLCI
jgi:hypothetical protein